MPHVVTQSCCSDASCVYACPVNCIQPTPDDPGFALAEMLHIDPAACVDCGACVSACPVDAIKPHQRLTDAEQPYRAINAAFFAALPRARPVLAPVSPPLVVTDPHRPLRVAVVGSGPAGLYAADELLTIPGARVTVYERLPEPYGLARFGVAPDHRLTRKVTRQLGVIAAHPRLRLRLGVEVGRDVTHEGLLAEHDAVIYAVGTPGDRRLAVPGATLPGVGSATELVAWYNGHPDAAGAAFDLSAHECAVVIGNGNVALDVARILAGDPEALARTDIAPRALRTLRSSAIREVTVVGRRGPEHAACTLPELLGLASTPGVELLTAPRELDGAAAGTAKLDLLRSLPTGSGGPRRVRLRFGLTPTAVLGTHRTTGVAFRTADGGSEVLDAGLVLTSIGYRAAPLPGLPFDVERGVVPHRAGRVEDPDAGPVARTFLAGWIKRGPTGFLGTNRSCAQETVRTLVADWDAGWRPVETPSLARAG